MKICLGLWVAFSDPLVVIRRMKQVLTCPVHGVQPQALHEMSPQYQRQLDSCSSEHAESGEWIELARILLLWGGLETAASVGKA